jgi:HK97 family phage prohead protease
MPVVEWKTFDFRCDEMKANEKTISGYGSVFGNVDLQSDVVEPGAFSESIEELKAAGRPLKMLWQHFDPIGPWTEFAEDARGLFVSGTPLVDEVQQAREAYALAKAQVVDGLSIGYRVVEYTRNQETGVRHLKKLNLVEVSLVTEPANPMARVSAVKSGISVRDMEAVLRDAGLSIKDAKRVAHRVLADLSPRDADGADLVESIRALARSIRS